MMERLSIFLPRRLAVPTVVVLLVGMLWLAAGGMPWPAPDRSPIDSPLILPGENRRAPEAEPARPEAPRLLPAPNRARWLPPPDDETRTVLTGFPLRAGEPGKPRPLPDTNAEQMAGPLLVFGGPDQPGDEPHRPGGDCRERPLWRSDARPGPLVPAPTERHRGRSLQGGAVEFENSFLVGPSGPSEPPEANRAPAAGTFEDPPGLLLRPPYDAAPRSRHLELAAREADLHTRRGFELAGRGAYFSTRAEFIMALRLMAQALDAEYQTTIHSRALAAGLTALKEAEDFIPKGSGLEADLDLETIVGGHRTGVLKAAQLQGLTPLAALQCYFTFAQEQLGAAGGREVAGSMALHGLGKLHEAMAGQPSASIRAARPKAMLFYQAALLVDPQNFMASNDLGVLLARAGRDEEARTVLEHSLAISRQSAGWQNLAMVYQRLGRTDLARRARHLSEVTRQAELARHTNKAEAAPGDVRWVDPGQFAGGQGQVPGAGPATPAHAATTDRAGQQPHPPAKQRIANWLPWFPSDNRK